MVAQFNLDYYNRVESNKVKQIPRLEERLKTSRKGYRTCCEFPEDHHAQLHAVLEKEEDLRDRIRNLNPLQTLETCADETYSSVPRFKEGSTYERKLPLDETDAELIRTIKDSLTCLKDWKFLQVRTEEISEGATVNYVLAFQYRGGKDLNYLGDEFYRFHDEDSNFPDLPTESVEELGLADLENKLPSGLTEIYKIQNVRVTPGYSEDKDIDFGVLFIKLELENREMQQGFLDAKASDLSIEAEDARRAAKDYKGS